MLSAGPCSTPWSLVGAVTAARDPALRVIDEHPAWVPCVCGVRSALVRALRGWIVA